MSSQKSNITCPILNIPQSLSFQQRAWDNLKKTIDKLIEEINVWNVTATVEALYKENFLKGRGLLVKSVMRAQSRSPELTHVYACLIAVFDVKASRNY